MHDTQCICVLYKLCMKSYHSSHTNSTDNNNLGNKTTETMSYLSPPLLCTTKKEKERLLSYSTIVLYIRDYEGLGKPTVPP